MERWQRVLLEVGYGAVHGASLRSTELLAHDVTICVGLMNTDFVEVTSEKLEFAATSTQLSTRLIDRCKFYRRKK